MAIIASVLSSLGQLMGLAALGMALFWALSKWGAPHAAGAAGGAAPKKKRRQRRKAKGDAAAAVGPANTTKQSAAPPPQLPDSKSSSEEEEEVAEQPRPRGYVAPAYQALAGMADEPWEAVGTKPSKRAAAAPLRGGSSTAAARSGGRSGGPAAQQPGKDVQNCERPGCGAVGKAGFRRCGHCKRVWYCTPGVRQRGQHGLGQGRAGG